MTALAWVAIACALLVSGLAPIVIRPMLSRLRVLDVPNERSSHSVPVLRGAGLAPFLGFLVGIYILVVALQPGTMKLLVIGAASASVGVLGLLEDIWGIRIIARFTVQLSVGAAATSVLVVYSAADLWWIPLGAVFFAGYTNAANFMDGINGISGLHGAAVGSTFAVIGIITDRPWLLAIGLVLAVSFAIFLPWNLARKRMFLGDVGSYLLGGAVGITAIAAVLDGAPSMAVVAPLGIYLADTASTLVKRLLRGEKWQQPHRSNVYQRLTAAGFPHLTSSLVVTTSTLLASVLGVLSIFGSVGWVIAAGGGILLVVAVYLSLPSIFESEVRKDMTTDIGRTLPSESHSARRLVPARWVVVGGTGFIGSALINELKLQGFRTATVSAPRLALNPNATPEEASVRLGDSPEAIDFLATSMVGAEVVVNAAGLATPDAAGSEVLFGANALLPGAILRAAERAQVPRLIHLSSAAVQGRRKVLDETATTSPFSPYSKSKALGEAILLAGSGGLQHRERTEVVILRATSVQGVGLDATARLRRLAQSPAASVAGSGDRPTVVSSVQGLVEFVASVGTHPDRIPPIILQPWEGMTTASVLEVAGGRVPRRVPERFCRLLVAGGYALGAVLPPVRGIVRRVELIWLGQEQHAAWAQSVGLEKNSYLADVFYVAPEGVH